MNKNKPIRLVSLLLTLMLLHGCATMLLSTAPVTSTTVQQHLVDDDIVKAVGYPTKNGERINGLVLIGNKFTYLLTEGDKKIERVVNKLNPKYLKMDETTTLVVSEGRFSAKLVFTYNRYDDEYTVSEVDSLKQLCTKQTEPGRWFGFGTHSYYDCWVYVSGSLFSSQESTFNESTKLSKGRYVRLVTNDQPVTGRDTKLVIDKLLALPVTVIFDVVTLPLQIFFLFGQGR